MSIIFNPFPEPLTQPLILTARNKKRVTVHLTESEESLCFQENVIDLKTFFQITLPRTTRFRAALFTGVFMLLFVVAVLLLEGIPGIGSATIATKLLSGAITGLIILVWLYYFVQGAWTEHVQNTRHAKAIAALYACKAFKPLSGYLQQLEPQLHGYFHPNQATDAAKFSEN